MGKRSRNRRLRDAAVPPQVESALVRPVAQLAKTPRVRREYHVGDEQRPKHRDTDRNLAMGSASRAPTNGQAALDRSVQIKETNERRRIGVDHETGEIVILRTAASSHAIPARTSSRSTTATSATGTTTARTA
ncbi:hypothetical protein [Micromonospora sp. NPDC007230]|uniref:hypothetical protein n=1 Tax=Micromonospora sp. NPDC007230 TaxID=3364237 RepID=UPI0036BE402C